MSGAPLNTWWINGLATPKVTSPAVSLLVRATWKPCISQTTLLSFRLLRFFRYAFTSKLVNFYPPTPVDGLTGNQLTKSGQEPNGIKLSPKQRRNREVVEL
jgi:hypothetical protein